MMDKKTLISIVGPTAIGKTSLAIAVAKHFNTGIISADSRQFYKEMSIGTAVPTKEELEAASHYFVQHKSIFDEYSVGDFEREAIDLLGKLFLDNEVVVMVGGSGLYTDAVVRGLDKFPEVDSSIRKELNKIFKVEGLGTLQTQLRTLDPEYAQIVDLDNPHRLIRALEICIGTGKPYSSFLSRDRPRRFFEVLTIGILADRNIIYDRINRRVDQMMELGLLAEAESLKDNKERNALQTVGYKELFAYFDGKWDLATAVSEIKKNTRRFAKRQLTWFRKNEDVIWVKYDDPTISILETIKNQLDTNSKSNG
jgi:tRNA dimethylallyltransferase